MEQYHSSLHEKIKSIEQESLTLQLWGNGGDRAISYGTFAAHSYHNTAATPSASKSKVILLITITITPLICKTSNRSVPRAHQSTAFPWPLLSRISGARYSGVPQKVLVPPTASYPVIPALARPKSVMRI